MGLGQQFNNGNVGIGTTGPQAILDLDVSNRADADKTGFLPPRMTTAQRDAISNPPRGSVIYNIDAGSEGLEHYNGTTWQQSAGAPLGIIVMWSGPLAEIPNGWALCDGTSGTPDLRDRFIYGVGTGENPGATGGQVDHEHMIIDYTFTSTNYMVTSTATSHASLQDRDAGAATRFGDTIAFSSGRSVHTGGIATEDGGADGKDWVTYETTALPPYYKLAYIMKL